MDTMFPNSLEIGESDDNGMTDIVCLGVGLVAMVFWPEHAKSIVTACNAHAQLVADNAALRADLNDARSNLEAGAEELRQADLVREQLVAALKPFAELAELFDEANRSGSMPSSGLICSWPRLHKEYELTVEHVRAARAALAGVAP